MSQGTQDTTAELTPAETARGRGEFRWYLAGYSAFFFAMGMSGVVLPWLIAIHLHESADRLGFAQMAGTLPNLLLVLFGGLAADRMELRGHLTRLTALAAIVPWFLIGTLVAGFLSYPFALAYGVLLGISRAFINPTRDALLFHVVQRTPGIDIAGAVSSATTAQFAAMLSGYALAGAASALGPTSLLCGVSAALAFSAFATTRLTPTRKKAPGTARAERPPRRVVPELRRIGTELSEGVSMVWTSPRLQPVIIQTFLVSMCGFGVFVVLMPILIRDVYGGGAQGIAMSLTAYFGGIASTAFVLRRRTPIRHQGRAMMLSSLGSATMMVLVSHAFSFWAVIALAYVWGLCAGLNTTASRTIIQQSAPPSHRARIMSVYSMGFAGGGPVGSLLIGFLIGPLGPARALIIPAATLGLIFLLMRRLTGLWHVEAVSRAPAPEPPLEE